MTTANWKCPHCDSQMEMCPGHGEWLLRCPRQDEETHPKWRYSTTENTAPPQENPK